MLPDTGDKQEQPEGAQCYQRSEKRRIVRLTITFKRFSLIFFRPMTLIK